ncbi:MAG: hypothetical protein IJZ74_07600, partial [Clostridia bacterium]|nr:hypothetical protein [Clostridia bacterium]
MFHVPHAFRQDGAAAAQPAKEQCGGFAPLSTRESGSLLQTNSVWKKMHIHKNNFRICGANLNYLLTFDLQVVGCAASSFSILRKKQRGPEG